MNFRRLQTYQQSQILLLSHFGLNLTWMLLPEWHDAGRNVWCVIPCTNAAVMCYRRNVHA